MWQYLKIAILFLVILTLFFRIHNFISHSFSQMYIIFSEYISKCDLLNVPHFVLITFFKLKDDENFKHC